MNTDRALVIKDLEKSYPGIKALDGVSLSFQKGEVHGLIGENGAGKSTLIKIIAGAVRADRGITQIDGEIKEIRSGREASEAGLCFIHQELNLISYFNAMENIYLGHAYPRKTGPLIDWKRLRKRTEGIMDSLQMNIPLGEPVRYLSAVDRAMVAIARAFAESGNVYFMDEPSTSLTDVEKEKLFSVINTLKEQGKTVVYVSHNLDDVLRITDRITVMRDGKVICTENTGDMTKDSLIASMIGRNLESAFPGKKPHKGKAVFRTENLSGGMIEGVSLEVRSGEVLGLGGLVGSGRTELLELIFGMGKTREGFMELDGEKYFPGSPKEAVRAGVVLVPEERRRQGLILNRSIRENISLMHLDSLAGKGFLRHKKIRSECLTAGRNVKLKTSDYSNPVSTLSGGNQQKVVFAKTVLKPPKLLLLDEPSKGVDVGARFEIYSVIRDLADRGTAIIVVSSDFNEILGLADRILFLKEGKFISLKENREIDQEIYLNYCYGRKI